MLAIFVSFWRAVYAGRQSVGGLHSAQTITYIMLSQLLAPAVGYGLVQRFGSMVREGMIALELLRPIDFQLRFYVEGLAALGCTLVKQVFSVGVIAVLFFGLRLPANPLVWLCFVVAFLLGDAILFCFDWIFSCLAFYSTEVWGLSELRNGVFLFFSGALVPLAMLPPALHTIANALPFGQAVYAPIAILSGITPLQQAPRVWLTQLLWLLGLGLLSRFVFSRSVRRVTVQGG